ncbi:MAG: hypothetical protein QOG74_1803 [Alphaproteobacteria bacterium]|nr:hypothetical protein [Alphaproteobacteria bacterium]
MNQARTIPSRAATQGRSTGVSALVAGIESSSILLPAPAALAQAGGRLDQVDAEILEWIAAHGRGKRRSRWVM